MKFGVLVAVLPIGLAAVGWMGLAHEARDGSGVVGSGSPSSFSSSFAEPLFLQTSGANEIWTLSPTPKDHPRFFAGRASLASAPWTTETIDSIGPVNGRVEAAELNLQLASTIAQVVNVRASLCINDSCTAYGADTVLLGGYTSLLPELPFGLDSLQWSNARIVFPFEKPIENASKIHIVIDLDLTPGADYFVRTDGASGLRFGGDEA